MSRSKTNVGFVPLANLQVKRDLGSGWGFRFDLDGLAAPQGRAFDAAFFIERRLFGAGNDSSDRPGLTAFGGYRTIEGGADNKEVYNFAWLHSATLGVCGEF